MRKVYIGNIPSAVTVTDIETEFDNFGTIVEARLLSDPTGAPYGTVEYDNDDSAPAAIAAKHNTSCWGCTIVVQEYAV